MKKYISLALAACLFAACEKEGEKFVVDGMETPSLECTSGDLVLTMEKASIPVLYFGWNESELSLSGGETEAALPTTVGQYTLEFSKTEDFAEVMQVTSSEPMVSYTGGELNVLSKDLGLEANKASHIYVRVNAALAANTESFYSNIIDLVVTPYSIDMSTAVILDKDKVETSTLLYSPEENGEYYGFVAAAGWYNWYLQLGDGVIWGNENVNWTPFEAMAGGGNFWYPGTLGCYYTTVSTNYKNWTATHLPALAISGDVTGDMAFVFADNKWYVSFTTTEANQSFTVSGTGNIYDTATGDAAFTETAVTFGNGGDGKLVYGGTEAFTVAEPGEYTFTMYLNDFNNLAWEITSGATEIVEPLAEKLYVLGINDNWDYATVPTLTLKSEVDSLYSGFINVESCPWGYYFSKTLDSWDGADLYKALSGVTDGSIVVGNTEGSDNIAWSGDAGLYYVEVNVSSAMKCTVIAMTDINYTGFNGDWSLKAMEKVANGIYAGTVTLSAASEWGGQVTNSAWSPKIGGTAGKLDYTGSVNFTDDVAAFASGAGDYDLIIDFNRHEYFFLGQQVYINGQGDVYGFDNPLNKVSYGIYEGDVEIPKATSWGIYFAVYKDNWDIKIGGANLSISADNYEAANDLAVGSYTVTLDLINRTCTFTAK